MKGVMIVLIRHAQSTGNCGDPGRDCPLSNDGGQQAKLLKGEYDLVICSTLKRARQTLDESSIKYSNILFTDLCREHLDGNPNTLYNNEPEKKESQAEFYDRIEKFKQILREKQKEYPRIAVVSHGVFLGTMTWRQYYNLQ